RYQDALEMAAAFREAAKLTGGEPVSLIEDLTLREQGILEQIIAGRTNREIAQSLYIELSTVKWYVRQIYRKLGVRSRRQAVVRARESQLFSREEQPGRTVETQPGVISTSQMEPINPYKGLRAFEVADAREFFGREALVKKLLSRLALKTQAWQRNPPLGKGRFLAVVGPSGSGKSSLIKAGLIPAIMKGEINSSEGWFIAQMEPGARPLDQLEVALVRLAADRAGNLREQLERDQFGLVRASGLILPHGGSELVLLIDQFEEVFTLVQEEAERARFLDLLSTAALEPNSRVRIVVALRADFYDRPLLYPVFGELVRNCLETVLPLSAEELERAILQPAAQVGVSFEPGLVAKIIEDVYYQPGALPMLQYALTELFEQRQERLLTHAAYQAIGGASGALAKRAEELYLEMNDEGQKAIQQIFLRLVNFGEDGSSLQQAVYTRQRALRVELLGLADEELIDEIIDTFSRYRLLSLDHEANTRRPTVELAHEALLGKWERLGRLLDESREDLYTYRRLSAQGREWEQAGRDPGYLLRGSRLDQFAGWADNTNLVLTEAERAFISSSLVERESRKAEEEARRQREIDTAHKLAETEARRAQEQVRAARRLRWLAAGLAVFLVVAIGAAWFALNQRDIARENEVAAAENAEVAAQNAVAAEAARGEAEQLASLRSREAQVNQSLALAAQSRLALQADNLDLALALAWEAVQIPDPPGQAQVALSEAGYAPGTIRVFLGHEGAVWSVAASPDGRYGLSGDENGVIYLWDLETGEALRRLEGHEGLVSGLAFTPDGRHAVSGSHDKTILYWDLETGEIIRRLEGHQTTINSVAISPDGRTAASGSGNRFHSDRVSSEDNSIRIWDLQSGEEMRRFDFFTDAVTGVEFTPDGRGLAVATLADGFLLLEIESGKALVRRTPEENYIALHPGPHVQAHAVAASPDSKYALTSDRDVWMWDLRTAEVTKLVGSHNGTVFGLDISPDGKRALSSSQMIIEYDLETREEIRRFNIGASSVAYRPDGRSALAGSEDGSLRLLALASGAEIGRMPAGDWVGGAAYDPAGRAVVTAESIRLSGWDLETGENIWSGTNTTGFFWQIAMSPDGRHVLASDFAAASIWDVATGEMLRRLESDGSFVGHDVNVRVSSVAFHPSGKFVLSGAQG
ncbi:MAG TPA: LuxR C-terminal-related transcriptional regulator, partial [Anaerolineales bacterium]